MTTTEKIPDQPEGIDEQSHDMPSVTGAAERVIDFVKWFGDGLVLGPEDDCPPLYARDLEALCRSANERAADHERGRLAGLAEAVALIEAAGEREVYRSRLFVRPIRLATVLAVLKSGGVQ